MIIRIFIQNIQTDNAVVIKVKITSDIVCMLACVHKYHEIIWLQ